MEWHTFLSKSVWVQRVTLFSPYLQTLYMVLICMEMCYRFLQLSISLVVKSNFFFPLWLLFSMCNYRSRVLISENFRYSGSISSLWPFLFSDSHSGYQASISLSYISSLNSTIICFTSFFFLVFPSQIYLSYLSC